ncbi:MAG: DUF362 domain-containing protein [Clostridia bacterium]|nr:DUF362 domain-containing protein [Clostridia bacterium]
MDKSKVYFIREVSSDAALKVLSATGKTLEGKIAVKLHSGEVGNQNFIRPDFVKPIIDSVNGTIVECNTAYEGARNTTDKHIETMKKHGWSDIAPVDILDGAGDKKLTVENGKIIKENYVGANIDNYDSMLVFSHFKGHPMGGFGGALKNISIGLASSYGKAYIHGAGEVEKIWSAEHNKFLASMADAAKSVVDYFDGKMVFVNVMCNMSVDCDCCAIAEDPAIADIGCLASLDPVALDKACLDLVYRSEDPGKAHLIERIESRNGIYTVECAEKLGIGSTDYELIEL